MKRGARRVLLGYGVLLVGAFLGLVGWLTGANLPTRREPELDVGRLFRAQQEALPEGWWMKAPRLWLKPELTLGVWAGKVSFQYRDEPWLYLWEEVHVFVNPKAARRAEVPSPMEVLAGKGVVPAGWGYAPMGAEEFRLGCAGDGVKEAVRRCSVRMQYEEYAFVLWVPIEKRFTLEDLQRFLEVTDREMGAFLEGSRLRVGLRRVPEEVKGWRREEW